MGDHIPLLDRLRYSLTKEERTEDFYRFQYEKFFSKLYDKNNDCLRLGPLRLPILSGENHPTREDAYYAMEIGDILFPAMLGKFGYLDEGPYEWGGVRISEGDVVFDCGANLGIFSLLAAYRGGEVFAFEPVPEARKLLKQTLDLNPELCERVTIVPYALGKETGEAEFTVLADTLVGSSMILPQEGRKIRAAVTTVDAFVDSEGLARVDFLKADIEGAERLMLAGARETLRLHSPKVSICTYHLPDDPEMITVLLRTANPRYELIRKWKKIYGSVPAVK
ncbi:FkbM family methyltransferase [Methanorbis rubei]|uniref:Methyltransferase FkbM domain-containing protein n=1 Tax=Methanorbis rubei TaxID=3028300 RepID=A0AAE4MDH3_9EURY|nr:hypothetical protein [Methanocorpusculaceae archaeon Cs1]